MHAGKTGVINENEVANCFSIFEMYMAFQTRYHAIIMPTVELLAEQCTVAANRMTELANTTATEDLQDPGVISDVEVKMVVETNEGTQNA